MSWFPGETLILNILEVLVFWGASWVLWKDLRPTCRAWFRAIFPWFFALTLFWTAMLMARVACGYVGPSPAVTRVFYVLLLWAGLSICAYRVADLMAERAER